MRTKRCLKLDDGLFAVFVQVVDLQWVTGNDGVVVESCGRVGSMCPVALN